MVSQIMMLLSVKNYRRDPGEYPSTPKEILEKCGYAVTQTHRMQALGFIATFFPTNIF